MEGFREFGDIQEHALKEILEEEMDEGNALPFNAVPVDPDANR